MDVILLVFFLTLGIIQAHAEEVCFDDVGCFADDPCHIRGFPPRSPDTINTRFLLFTRSNRDDYQELSRHDVDGLRASNFDPKRTTKMFVHGWWANGLDPEELERKDAFLEMEDANVIVVDWQRGAAEPLYGVAHQNTRVVGREIGLLARFLNLETGMFFKDVHLIGMSLGAHAAGYAGENQPGFGRISGLDPAGPFFRDEGFEFRDNGPECRLDPTDAIFVDVIHTDANEITGLGQMLQLGHIDFYPNGGRRQAGCNRADLFSGCSHSRSWKLFTESIRSACSFTAYPCESWAQFVAGNCVDCGARGCPIMGYRADESTAVTGKFYLYTNGERPYCMAD
ncbi:pancreatic triacylglycerol lipase [Strongylocentrotus purpuratus]|uniref:Lipase domain-containing protein n=1 Tax=Strongylocentrotus purpuratus TaxID=7668 RepID=A0A7M7RCI2_STRPU|nr:pancreatic triacylglycerol lipase [Strongylocentrotus purpuratus]|eukprot:XP_788536.1 PREDICTED: pancreatic triacylglycerol lipase isoform X2 [Strongylocentrotus purpuratus]